MILRRKIDCYRIKINDEFKNKWKWKRFWYDCFEIIQWNEIKLIFHSLQNKIAKTLKNDVFYVFFWYLTITSIKWYKKFALMIEIRNFFQKFICMIKSKKFIFLAQISNLNVSITTTTIFRSIIFWATIAIFFVFKHWNLWCKCFLIKSSWISQLFKIKLHELHLTLFDYNV